MNKNIDIEAVKQQGRLNKHRIEMNLPVRCPVCQKQLDHKAQYAHLISQGKQMTKKYGKEIINHHFNGMYVCSLECNNMVQLNGNELQKEILYKEILEDLNK